MAYIGLRDVDPLERTILDRLNVPSYSMREIDQLGVREVKTTDPQETRNGTAQR